MSHISPLLCLRPASVHTLAALPQSPAALSPRLAQAEISQLDIQILAGTAQHVEARTESHQRNEHGNMFAAWSVTLKQYVRFNQKTIPCAHNHGSGQEGFGRLQ